MPARARSWLNAALLWLGLLITVNGPRWLHCSPWGPEPGCTRSRVLDVIDVGIPLTLMMIATALGSRWVAVAGPRRRPGLLLLTLAVAVLGLVATALVMMARQGPAIGLPPAYAVQALLMQAGCLVAAYQYMRRAQHSQHSARQLQRDQLALEQQLDQARLQVLQAQVEPHFLFNTLAHLRRLAQTDPHEARAMLADLLAYLREALPELREAESTLAQELRLVRAYLALHQRRMGDSRLRVILDVPAELGTASLPSTALLTLAENAIKHGIAPVVTGGHVRVSARREGEQLVLEVADTGRGMTEGSGHGTGLATLRARLKALYGDAGSLHLAMNEPRGLVVRLQLPLRRSSTVAPLSPVSLQDSA